MKGEGGRREREQNRTKEDGKREVGKYKERKQKRAFIWRRFWNANLAQFFIILRGNLVRYKEGERKKNRKKGDRKERKR
jgi:hypothetical protein